MGIWQQIIDALGWFNQKPSVTDLLLVIITGLYARPTFRISQSNKQVVSVMRDQLIALERPYIEISTFLRPRSIIVYLRIKIPGKLRPIIYN